MGWTAAGLMAMSLGMCGSVSAQVASGDKSMAMTGDVAGKSFDDVLSVAEKEIVGTAEAMPADKFDFAPSQAIFTSSQKVDFTNPKAVSTFAEMVKHLAQANYYFFGSKTMKPQVDVKAIKSLKSKDEIIAALKASFAYAHMTVSSMTTSTGFVENENEGEKSTLAATYAFGLMHMNDHYGQLNEYLRMNGIVPPASRK
jgi:uncharacterized damage-inducible protein DinB